MRSTPAPTPHTPCRASPTVPRAGPANPAGRAAGAPVLKVDGNDLKPVLADCSFLVGQPGERLVAQLGTEQHWLERKRACFANVYTDMTSLIADSQEQSNVSLAAFRPAKIKEFVVEDDEWAWKPEH